MANTMRTIETTTTLEVDECAICGADLSDTPSHECERRTKIDIWFEKRVEHVDAEVKKCSECDTINTAKFPDDMPGPLQYGQGIKAFAINLICAQMIALGRVQKMIKTLIGTVISETTMLNFVLRLHLALEGWENRAKQQILASSAMNVDETSFRVNKKTQWIHVYCADHITLKFLHAKRGTEAIDNIGIIPKYGGTIIHDCWSSYLSYKHCGHGLCGSHLLRELTFVIESNQYAWARNMKRLLKESCKLVAARNSKKLTSAEYANLQKRYRNIITRGRNELPPVPDRAKGKRGKLPKSDAHNLWERLKEHESFVLAFARESSISFTNNRAERDLRMTKVKQKVSGCFRTEQYAHAYCRISSYLQTMSAKGYNPLVAIQMAFAGEVNV